MKKKYEVLNYISKWKFILFDYNFSRKKMKQQTVLIFWHPEYQRYCFWFSLRADELLKQLAEPENAMMAEVAEKGSSDIELHSHWCPEYASYMVEGTPGKS